MKSTEKLQRSVVNELAWDPSVDSSAIAITASGDGVITLEGEVPTYRIRHNAEKAAKRVSGVKAVANDLEVTLVRAARHDDTELAEAAVRALRWHSSVPRDEVRVTVDDGWVTLEGRVDWQYQRRAAYEAVRDLRGVKGVANRIALTRRARPDDIRKQIRSAFQRSADLDADHVDLEVDGDTIILRGTVSTDWEREEAERVAWRAPGVGDVINEIDVKRPELSAA